MWHLCVRVASNKKMVACITAVPVLLNIKGTLKKMVEINFLCVHKKLRSKRLAPVLIKEITRRVNCNGIFQVMPRQVRAPAKHPLTERVAACARPPSTP